MRMKSYFFVPEYKTLGKTISKICETQTDSFSYIVFYNEKFYFAVLNNRSAVIEI